MSTATSSPLALAVPVASLPKIVPFRDWLLTEAERDRRGLQRLAA